MINAQAFKLESRFRRAPKLIPSGPKAKDFAFKSPPFLRALPPSLWLKEYIRLRDQLSIGSCVGNSISFLLESIRNKFRAYDQDSDLSRELAYTLAKLESGLLGQGDTGASIRGGLDAMRKYGLCAERFVPYDLHDWDAMPAQPILDLCEPHKITLYERITVDKDNYRNTIESVKQALVSGLRVVAGVYVPRGMFYIAGPLVDHHKQWNWTDPNLSTIVGAHAIAVGGYDDTIYPAGLGSILLGNSWGPTWGDQGWTAVPWITFNQYAFELWAIHDFDGFADGAAIDPPLDPPLDPQLIAQDRADFAGLGLGTLNADGSFAFAPDAVLYFAAWRMLQRKGRTPEQADQSVGMPTGTVRGFIESPANADRIAAWARLL